MKIKIKTRDVVDMDNIIRNLLFNGVKEKNIGIGLDFKKSGKEDCYFVIFDVPKNIIEESEKHNEKRKT